MDSSICIPLYISPLNYLLTLDLINIFPMGPTTATIII